jgi:hypothetical protein
MDSFDPALVTSLRMAQNEFLQVLLPEFRLKRHGSGTRLIVQFDDQIPAIRMSSAKQYLREWMRSKGFEEKRGEIQGKLDALLLRQAGEPYVHNNPAFPFRYCSGGTLPIISMGSKDYLCLFFRDIHPIGWNIANGACDSLDELRNPVDTIERELREELLILDPLHGKRYVFRADAVKPLDRPEFAVARRFWHDRNPDLNLASLQEIVIPLKWLEGPDSLEVWIGKYEPKTVTGCFLNINAEDLGIELDRVARISVHEGAILADGELKFDCLVNTPVALFELGRFTDEFRAQKGRKEEFLPDLFYYDLNRYPGTQLGNVVGEQFWPHIKPHRSLAQIAEFEATEKKYVLCPVTQQIVERFMSVEGQSWRESPQGDYEVFISYAGEDKEFARIPYNFCAGVHGKNVFFSEERTGQSLFGREIDNALEKVHLVIVAGTKPDYLRKEYVSYEWGLFHRDQCYSRPGQMISFVPKDFDKSALPGPLRVRECIHYDPCSPETALGKLAKWLSRLF